MKKRLSIVALISILALNIIPSFTYAWWWERDFSCTSSEFNVKNPDEMIIIHNWESPVVLEKNKNHYKLIDDSKNRISLYKYNFTLDNWFTFDSNWKNYILAISDKSWKFYLIKDWEILKTFKKWISIPNVSIAKNTDVFSYVLSNKSWVTTVYLGDKLIKRTKNITTSKVSPNWDSIAYMLSEYNLWRNDYLVYQNNKLVSRIKDVWGYSLDSLNFSDDWKRLVVAVSDANWKIILVEKNKILSKGYDLIYDIDFSSDSKSLAFVQTNFYDWYSESEIIKDWFKKVSLTWNIIDVEIIDSNDSIAYTYQDSNWKTGINVSWIEYIWHYNPSFMLKTLKYDENTDQIFMHSNYYSDVNESGYNNSFSWDFILTFSSDWTYTSSSSLWAYKEKAWIPESTYSLWVNIFPENNSYNLLNIKNNSKVVSMDCSMF